MKTFSVQTLPWSSASDSDVALIVEGFSWPALIFGPFWALWHGLWRSAIVWVVIVALVGGVGALTGVVTDAVSAVLLLVQIGFGLWGNDLRRAALARRGYVEHAVVAGRDGVEAEHRYFTTVAHDAV